MSFRAALNVCQRLAGDEIRYRNFVTVRFESVEQSGYSIVLKTQQDVRFGICSPRDFQSNLPFPVRSLGQVNNAKTAAPEWSDDFVGTDFRWWTH